MNWREQNVSQPGGSNIDARKRWKAEHELGEEESCKAMMMPHDSADE